MPLSPTATRDLLAQLGHSPKRFLGQNFLVDGNIVRKSLELAGIVPGDTVVEIGPGLGTLTSALLDAGAEVWAVEKDSTLCAHLQSTLAPQFPERLHLLLGDAVEFPLAGLQRSMGDERTIGLNPSDFMTGAESMQDENAPSPVSVKSSLEFKVVANLPYAIATPWLDEVLSGPLPSTLVLMLQQEAAQRYTASPGTKSVGGISIFLQSAYTVAPGHKVPAACFYPRPDIESYLLNLVRRPNPFIFAPETKALIRACFQQRRKQIGSLLRNRLPDGGAAWLEHLRLAGLSGQSRPEDIPSALWQRLTPPPATAT